MTMTINIEMDNAAFDDGGSGSEVYRIVCCLMDKQGFDGRDLLPGESGHLLDINGNKVGKWGVK